MLFKNFVGQIGKIIPQKKKTKEKRKYFFIIFEKKKDAKFLPVYTKHRYDSLSIFMCILPLLMQTLTFLDNFFPHIFLCKKDEKEKMSYVRMYKGFA